MFSVKHPRPAGRDQSLPGQWLTDGITVTHAQEAMRLCSEERCRDLRILDHHAEIRGFLKCTSETKPLKRLDSPTGDVRRTIPESRKT
jgi:hypothetical protein